MADIKKEFYSKTRDSKKTVLICLDNEKLSQVIFKLLSPVAEVIVVDNFSGALKYEEIVSYKKEKIEVVFMGVLMDGVDGFLLCKDIFAINKLQKVCSLSKKEENELFKTMFPDSFFIKQPMNLDDFFSKCLEMDI